MSFFLPPTSLHFSSPSMTCSTAATKASWWRRPKSQHRREEARPLPPSLNRDGKSPRSPQFLFDFRRIARLFQEPTPPICSPWSPKILGSTVVDCRRRHLWVLFSADPLSFWRNNHPRLLPDRETKKTHYLGSAPPWATAQGGFRRDAGGWGGRPSTRTKHSITIRVQPALLFPATEICLINNSHQHSVRHHCHDRIWHHKQSD